MRPLLTLLTLLASLSACSPDADPALDHEVQQVVWLPSELRALPQEGAHLVTPWLAPDGGVTQTAFMVDLEGEEGELEIEVRERTPGGDSAWRPVAPSFSEGPHRVYVFRSDALVSGYQARFGVASAARAKTVTWAADRVERAPEADLEVRQQGLAAVYAQAGVISREEWGAAATRCNSQNATKDKIAIHHTVTQANTTAAQLRQIQNFHMSGRDWCDIGYHFLVTVDGKVWEGRPVHLLGTHVGGHNTNNIGVSFVGCFHPTSDCANLQPDVPPEVMIANAGSFLSVLVQEYGINVTAQTLKGHRDHSGASTACPGDNLHARLDDLRAAARDGDPPTPTNGTIRGVVYDRSVTEGPADDGNVRLPDATVTCDCGMETRVASGDAQWSFDLPAGTYTLTASAPGYEPASATRTVGSGETVWSSIGLTPATASPDTGTPEPDTTAEPDTTPEPEDTGAPPDTATAEPDSAVVDTGAAVDSGGGGGGGQGGAEDAAVTADPEVTRINDATCAAAPGSRAPVGLELWLIGLGLWVVRRR